MSDTSVPDMIDFFGADRFSALGDAPVLIVDAAGCKPLTADIQAVTIGVDRVGFLPTVDPTRFDLLLTSAPDAPPPWVSVAAERLEGHAGELAAAVREWPMAATVLCRVLRLSAALPFADALDVESMAYSTLLGGSEFARWRASAVAGPLVQGKAAPLLVEREGNMVTLTLNHPESRNAMTAAMRDALYVALATVLEDPSEPSVELKAAGRCFSAGGALGEFGTTTDLAQAHIVRRLRSCADLLNRLGDRATVRLHGACIGSGLEVPAAAAHRIAMSDAWFQLPELHMGLIPGAGGTASVARAIGRHRTAWMVLSGKRIDAHKALDWGLVHEITQ